MSLIDFVATATSNYIEQMPKAQRKSYGQFFTSCETAQFMARLFDLDSIPSTVSILDPGAGSGMLATALIERLAQMPKVTAIDLVCYENDPQVLPLLRSNLAWVKEHCQIELTYQIKADNYILSQAAAYNDELGLEADAPKFDLVIGNPPYCKISKDAPEARALPDVCYGAPNLYFLFAAMSLFNLKDSCELVYIIPRSWTSGAYFERFRSKFLSQGALEHIHLFVSRDKVFTQESVLQETVIIKVKKTTERPECITVSTSQSNGDFSELTSFQVPYHTVVQGPANYVYLITNEQEAQTLEQLSRLKDTLPSLGLKMRTGLTVDYRNQTALRDHAEAHAVPLFYAHHIKKGQVQFPLGKEHEFLVTEQGGLLQKNSNYLFVKRFTAKEEPRRLQCGVYLARQFPEYEQISTQNKINFICGQKELSEDVVYGLYVLFNSTPYDRYYRLLNGSTQVNSTEINAMPVPPINTISAMGEALLQGHDMSEAACDQILMRFL